MLLPEVVGVLDREEVVTLFSALDELFAADANLVDARWFGVAFGALGAKFSIYSYLVAPVPPLLAALRDRFYPEANSLHVCHCPPRRSSRNRTPGRKGIAERGIFVNLLWEDFRQLAMFPVAPLPLHFENGRRKFPLEQGAVFQFDAIANYSFKAYRCRHYEIKMYQVKADTEFFYTKDLPGKWAKCGDREKAVRLQRREWKKRLTGTVPCGSSAKASAGARRKVVAR